jgi:uncharacterized ferredoxin-like protein
MRRDMSAESGQSSGCRVSLLKNVFRVGAVRSMIVAEDCRCAGQQVHRGIRDRSRMHRNFCTPLGTSNMVEAILQVGAGARRLAGLEVTRRNVRSDDADRPLPGRR